jgi:hypothetical protein
MMMCGLFTVCSLYSNGAESWLRRPRKTTGLADGDPIVLDKRLELDVACAGFDRPDPDTDAASASPRPAQCCTRGSRQVACTPAGITAR